MEWNEVREYLRIKIHDVVDWGMLQVIRSSDTRRFQLQVTKPVVETVQTEDVSGFPRIIYRSCDKSVTKILQHGLIPGGWPKSSGRAHNYFIANHPWDGQMQLGDAGRTTFLRGL